MSCEADLVCGRAIARGARSLYGWALLSLAPFFDFSVPCRIRRDRSDGRYRGVAAYGRSAIGMGSLSVRAFCGVRHLINGSSCIVLSEYVERGYV